MIHYTCSFRCTSPECLSPDHLRAPLMNVKSVNPTGVQRKVQSAVLQRTARPTAKSLYFISVLYQSEFWNLESPRLLITELPFEQCCQHSNERQSLLC